MPNVVCPTCKTTLSVTDAMLGGDVQCGQCQQVFRTTSVPPAPKRTTARRDEDEEEDDDRRERPTHRSRRDEDEEEDRDRPTRRSRARRDDDEDEEDDRRRRRRRSRRGDDDEYEDDRRSSGGGNGAAVTAMILGIIAVVAEIPATMLTAFGSIFCCGLGGVFTWPAHILGVALGITGLILGILGMKKKDGKGMAVAGLATSIGALVLGVISVILIAAGYAAWDRALRNAPVFIPPPPPAPGPFGPPRIGGR